MTAILIAAIFFIFFLKKGVKGKPLACVIFGECGWQANHLSDCEF
jgi:hypothetical protein